MLYMCKHSFNSYCIHFIDLHPCEWNSASANDGLFCVAYTATGKSIFNINYILLIYIYIYIA